MARAGESVELASRDVTIHRLDLVEWDGSDADRPIAILDVECSAGTYVRALARDLGEAVGSAAYLGALSRTSSGPFRLEEAIPLDRVREAAAEGQEALTALLRPIDAGLESLPELVLTDGEVTAISRGQYIRAELPAGDAGAPIRVRDGSGRLVAIATVRDGRLAPDKVLVDAPSAIRAADA
jgi:tRNA pseudouridine55 synthase